MSYLRLKPLLVAEPSVWKETRTRLQEESVKTGGNSDPEYRGDLKTFPDEHVIYRKTNRTTSISEWSRLWSRDCPWTILSETIKYLVLYTSRCPVLKANLGCDFTGASCMKTAAGLRGMRTHAHFGAFSAHWSYVSSPGDSSLYRKKLYFTVY